MGKWSTYQKRGSAAFFGTMPAPADADWTVGTPTTTTIPCTRVAAVPGGATQMLWRAINNTTNVLAAAFQASPVSGLTTGTQYRVQAAWFNGGVQVSDASPAKLATTA